MAKIKVFAVHEIRRMTAPGKDGDPTRGIRPIEPTVQTIEPGSVFLVNEDDAEVQRWLVDGAIRRWNENDSKAYANLSNVIGEFDKDEMDKVALEKQEAERKRAEAEAAEAEKVKAAESKKTAKESTKANDIV